MKVQKCSVYNALLCIIEHLVEMVQHYKEELSVCFKENIVSNFQIEVAIENIQRNAIVALYNNTVPSHFTFCQALEEIPEYDY
jgi:hypothetical protein